MDALLTIWGNIPAMKTCPFRDCTLQIADDTFSCLRHWYFLDPGQRHAINCAEADLKAGRISADKLAEIEGAMVNKVQGKRLF